MRWKDHGDPLAEVKERRHFAEPDGAFWARVDRSGGPDACWPWLDHINECGYGMFYGGQRRAHRIAYQLLVGLIPPGLELDHTCHTEACPGGRECLHRRCVNPAHLEPVTKSENARRREAVKRARRSLHSHGT